MYYYPQNAYGGNQAYYPQQPAQPSGIKGRPVSSMEEVKAAQIDFDGSLFVFPDIANKKIYTKQINLDGTATLNMYELTQQPVPQTEMYVTRDEFTEALKQLKETINEKGGTPQAFNF